MREIKSLSQFNALKSSSQLLIIDFYATWCGPCKAISPVFDKLSANYTSTPNAVVFARSDVDKAQDVARTCGITAMPTFQFFRNGTKVDEVRGADVQQLTTKIGYYAQAAVKEAANGTGANTKNEEKKDDTPGSLLSLVDVPSSKLLNVSNLSTIKNIVSPPPAGYAVASTPGSQLLIHLSFTQAVSPAQLKITIDTKDLSNAPSRIQVGANVPISETEPLGMSSLSKTENTQAINVFSDEYVNGVAELKLKQSKFKNVKSLTIRVDANLSGEESKTTKILKLDVVGVQA